MSLCHIFAESMERGGWSVCVGARQHASGGYRDRRNAMQMPALLLAILLAGGNPVWDRQSTAGQAQICSDQAAARTESVAASPNRKQRRGSTCARSEEHTSELQSLMRISYAVFCLKKKKKQKINKKQP